MTTHDPTPRAGVYEEPRYGSQLEVIGVATHTETKNKYVIFHPTTNSANLRLLSLDEFRDAKWTFKHSNPDATAEYGR